MIETTSVVSELNEKKRKLKKKSKASKKDLIFFCVFIAWPVLQFCVFYIGVNINSLLLSFQTYDVESKTYYFGDLFVNFARVFKNFTQMESFKVYFLNSLYAFISHVFFGISIGVLTANFIYKKGKASNFFKIMVMVPAFISSVIFVSIFSKIVDNAIPKLILQQTGEIHQGLLMNKDTCFWTIMAYGLWFGTGGSMLLYLNAMDQVPDSLIDAAKIDGCGYFQELIHVTLPQIWQTFVVFFTVSVATYFTNVMGIYAFLGKGADPSTATFGYFYYVSVLNAGKADYPYFSAIGLLCTAIALPVTLLVRRLLLKKGPSNE